VTDQIISTVRSTAVAAGFGVMCFWYFPIGRIHATVVEEGYAPYLASTFAHNERLVEEDTRAEAPGACLFGRTGPESSVIIGVDSTLYLLSPGQGFLLPWGEYARLATTASGGVSIITSTDTIAVSECSQGMKEWVWASPFHNPRARGDLPGDVIHSGRFPGRHPQEVSGHRETRAHEVPRDNRVPGDSNQPAPAEVSFDEAIAQSRDNTPVIRERIDARLHPHPPILHILGSSHTALVELWYEGNQEVNGIHLFLEPEGEIVSIVSVETVGYEEGPFSLTYGQSAKGGLQIRFASEAAHAPQPGPLLSILLESHAPGVAWIRLERIVVATDDGLWSLPDDSLQVLIEN
jgi:hypothetical protein